MSKQKWKTVEKICAREQRRRAHLKGRRTMTTRKALIWKETDDGTRVAMLERGSRYSIHDMSRFGGRKPNWVARRRTRSGYGDKVIGARATLAEAKALCEQHLSGRRVGR